MESLKYVEKMKQFDMNCILSKANKWKTDMVVSDKYSCSMV